MCLKDCDERCRLWPHPVFNYRWLDSACHVTVGREYHVRTGVLAASGDMWHQRSKPVNRTYGIYANLCFLADFLFFMLFVPCIF
jgi:hypothetical protein